jgi:hypothetical protein
MLGVGRSFPTLRDSRFSPAFAVPSCRRGSGACRAPAARKRLEGLDGVAAMRLTDKDAVHHPLVGRILSVL